MQELQNKNVYIRFNDEIFFRDKLDVYNDFSGYTTKKRNIKKAWQEITDTFTEETKFNDIRNILNDKFNLSVHTYCGMD
jgi:hypothetical protein